MSNRPAIPAETAREVLIESGHRCAVCGAGCPLERAHIVPWHKSREHKAEDLICLCANCHQRADLEKWGEKTLREYKRKPWVLRQHEKAEIMPEPTTKVELTIEMELRHFDRKLQRWLQNALAAFLDISPNVVRITSIEKGSVKVTIELPTQSAERLLSAYKRNDSELDKHLAPMVLLDLRREGAGRERIQPQKRVLVVEDTSTWQKLICELLQEVASNLDRRIEIVIASSFSEALDQIATTSFDSVTLDNKLEDGKMARTLLDRVAGLEQRVPVVVVSGVVDPSEVRDFFQDYRIKDFFWKDDFKPEEFRQTFARLLAHVEEEDAEMFTWLHLSDLHFEGTKQREYQISQVVGALVSDLGRLREEYNGLKPDAVFFTGDLANKAKPKEFTKGWEESLNKVLRACELQPRNLFVVPGNHDVNRTQTTELDARIVQGLFDASQVFALLNDPDWKGYRQQLFQRMDSYQTAVGSIAGLPFDAEALSWGQTLETGDGKKIGVIGLNSAWTSASVKGWDGEVDDQGKLIIGKPLAQAALEQIEQPRPSTCIALMHHPLNWLQDWDEQDIKQVLGETCQFILHGHVHHTTIEFLGTPAPSSLVISAGALFKKYDRSAFYTCLHAYNIVQLDLANSKGTIYFRRFDPVSERYGIDDTTFKDVRNGQYSFRYGEDGFRSGDNLGQ